MKLIRENSLPDVRADDFIRLWEDQGTTRRSFRMEETKPSRYHFFRNYERGGVLLSTLTEAAAVLDPEEAALWQSYSRTGVLEDKALLRAFFDAGFAVPAKEDELCVLSLVTNRLLHSPVRQLKVAVNTTYQCNARCAYCFEWGSERRPMSLETADSVVDYVCRAMTPDKRLTFRWFGGEPLMAPEIIDRIIAGVRERLGPSLCYEGAILTNGTLITQELAEKITGDWRIREMHFTIDGCREHHNRVKNFSQEQDGYQAVLDGMRRLLPRIERVTCRVNLDRTNAGELDQIWADLAELKGLGNLNVYPAAVRAHNEACLQDCFSYEEYADLFREVYRKMDAAGLLRLESILPVRKVICCSAKAVNEVVIGTEGEFYKCMQTSIDEQAPIGSCKEGLYMNEEVRKWLTPFWQETCTKCGFLPVCQGGCKGYRGLNNPHISPCAISKFTMPAILDLVALKNGLLGGFQ